MKRMKAPPKRSTTSDRRVKEKFIPEMSEGDEGERYVSAMPRFEAKNDNQRLALKFLNEGRPVTFLVGAAGSGKSMIAAYHAAKMLKSKKIDKVFLIRPAVAVGKTLGFLPGSAEEKLAPFFAQTVAHMTKFLGAGTMQYMLEKKIIEMKAVEYLRGMSFENCICIVEEVQGFTVDEFQMLLTRLGEGGSFIMTGDERQNDLKGLSGLRKTLDMFGRALKDAPEYLLDSDLDEIESGIGIVEFTPHDVIRSGLTRAFVRLYYYST